MIKNHNGVRPKQPIGLFLRLFVQLEYPLLNVSCEEGCVLGDTPAKRNETLGEVSHMSLLLSLSSDLKEKAAR